MDKFDKETRYIVWNPESELPPTVIHKDRQSAISVAYRMSAENPGQSFAVCKIVGYSYMEPSKPHFTDTEKKKKNTECNVCQQPGSGHKLSCPTFTNGR
jgi:hypothetical protein